MLLENLYDRLSSGKEVVSQTHTACTIWQKKIYLNVWMDTEYFVCMVTNRKMYIRGLSGNLAFKKSCG